MSPWQPQLTFIYSRHALQSPSDARAAAHGARLMITNGGSGSASCRYETTRFHPRVLTLDGRTGQAARARACAPRAAANDGARDSTFLPSTSHFGCCSQKLGHFEAPRPGDSSLPPRLKALPVCGHPTRRAGDRVGAAQRKGAD